MESIQALGEFSLRELVRVQQVPRLVFSGLQSLIAVDQVPFTTCQMAGVAEL